MEDVSGAIIEQLTASCAECGVTNDIIDKQSFACFPESPTYVTYRARLEGTSETDSGSLISLIEKWVSGGASIIVTGILLRVDSECSVAISSLSEGECSPIQPPPTNVVTDTEPAVNTTTATSNPNGTTGMPPITTDSTTDSETLPTSTDQTSSDNTVAVVGGVVAVALIFAITVIIIVIVVLVLKYRHGDLSLKNTER